MTKLDKPIQDNNERAEVRAIIYAARAVEKISFILPERMDALIKVKKEINKSNKNKMTKKTKTIEFDDTIVKLDRESFEKLKDMFNSPDKENHVVAFSVLENLETKPNLVYLMLLYKLYKDTTGDGWKSVVVKVEKVLKAMKKGKLDDTTFNNYWKILYGNYPVEEIQMVIDQYSDILKGHIEEWGFFFLKECDWKITVRPVKK